MPMPRGRPRLHVNPCKFCQKQFRRQEHLQRHERIHTREKPFACFCGERFSRRDLLTRHHRQAHTPDPTSGFPVATDPMLAPVQPSTAFEHISSLQLDAELSDQPPGPTAAEMLIAQENMSMERESQTSGNDSGLSTGQEPLTSGEVSESIEVRTTPQMLITTSEGTDEFDFLWNDIATDGHPLPASIVNADFSIVDFAQPMFSDLGGRLPDAYGATSTDEPANQHSGFGHESGAHVLSTSLVSRLPSLEPGGQEATTRNAGDLDNGPVVATVLTQKSPPCPWRVSREDYQKLSADFAISADNMHQSFIFPSRYTLSRYLEGYFRGFHGHMPFLHLPTLCPSDLGSELILALAAVGALYRFEHAKGIELYRLARALINKQLDNAREESLSRLTKLSPTYAEFSKLPKSWEGMQAERIATQAPIARLSPVLSMGQSGLRLLQGLLVLMAITSWGDPALVHDALSMASQVALLIRELGIGMPERLLPDDCSWEDWLRDEERRRTLFVGYVLFNLQCVAFNTPPLIPNSEICLSLPASDSEWKAQSAQEWSASRTAMRTPPLSFQAALKKLLSGQPIHEERPVSAFGNYVLIHGLFQQVYYVRSNIIFVTNSEAAITERFVENIEAALKVWQQSWEAANESTLDPSSPKGPLGFNATALLRLVHIRLVAHTSSISQLINQRPDEVARFLSAGAINISDRSPCLNRAILQCVHTLSVPIRVGIAYVARTQTLNWSIQHALCSIECAFLLAHWLRALALLVENSGVESLTPDEQKLLRMVATLIRETEFSGSLETAQDPARQIRRLAIASVRIWAETFAGPQVFGIVHMIGHCLNVAADMLETNESHE